MKQAKTTQDHHTAHNNHAQECDNSDDESSLSYSTSTSTDDDEKDSSDLAGYIIEAFCIIV